MVGGGLTIGGWFAGAVIANFVGKARSILEERHELQGDVAKMLLNVQGSLLHIRAAIDVAERRPVVDGAITDWLQMIKGIASDAEDLLDDFETKRIQKSQQNKVSGVLAYLMKNLVLDDDIHKLKGLLERLDSIASKAGSFIGLLKMNDSEEALTRFLPEIEPVFLGREEEKDKLMSIIFPDAAHLGASRMQEVTMGTASVRIVCIVGEAGVGKTALAQVIYNHPNVKEAFDLRGWVFLSQRSDLNDFFKKIVRSFAAEQHPFDSEMGLEALQASSDHDLSSIIQNKRFFLVLDNAKDNLQREWKTLSAKLTGGAAGSIVLVTTRSAVVAESKVITLPAMPIDTLSTILEHHAFGDNRRKDCLKSIGKEIASKMHGLPLSAEVIGRLLRTKLDEKQWRKVSRSEWWDDYEDKAITNHALPSLTIALEFLSAPLKECLGYCSMFPSSYLFDKHSLAHMWMCDSMQQHHESVSETREIQWFDELCSRCLVQPTVQKNKYIVNETIKDILASTTQTGCYTVEDSRRPRTNLCGFSYIAINKGDLNVSLSLREHMKVRSILIFDGQRTTRLNTALDAILPHRSAMRVLDLSCIETNMERPPDVIITYSHLRYLDLSFTGITVFPESFCGLHHLQVLGMRGCRFKEMPRHMNKLVNLRYLYAEVCTLSLIHSIGQLTNLQCLEEFAVNDMDGHRITELKILNYLGGHLCISNLDKVTCIEVSDTELSRKMYIQKLVLKWQPESASSGSCMQTLSHLKPNGNLEDLEIQFYMGVLFPEWIANHSHFTMLRYIKFSGCQKLEKLPPLGKLSHLKILILQHLEQIQSIGDEFYGSYECVFPSLEELTFCDMINWQTWLDIKTPQIIPRIRKIVIKNCRRLSDLPKSVLKGSLKELELYNCKEIFRKGSCCLEYLETLKRLKIHNCLGITINIPRTLLASIEVLNLQNCKVCFEGGQEHVHSLRRFLTIDCDEVREGKKRKFIFDAQSPFSSNNVDIES